MPLAFGYPLYYFCCRKYHTYHTTSYYYGRYCFTSHLKAMLYLLTIYFRIHTCSKAQNTNYCTIKSTSRNVPLESKWNILANQGNNNELHISYRLSCYDHRITSHHVWTSHHPENIEYWRIYITLRCSHSPLCLWCHHHHHHHLQYQWSHHCHHQSHPHDLWRDCRL